MSLERVFIIKSAACMLCGALPHSISTLAVAKLATLRTT